MQRLNGYHKRYRMRNRTRYWTTHHSTGYLTCYRVRNRTCYRFTGPFPQQYVNSSKVHSALVYINAK